MEECPIEKSTAIQDKEINLSSRIEERKVICKINRVAVPFMLLAMFFQKLDHMTLNLSAMLGIYDDVNITHNEFGIAGSLYYLGEISFQLVVVFFLQRFSLSQVMGIPMLFWGTSMIGSSFATNFAQLGACRFCWAFLKRLRTPLFFSLSEHTIDDPNRAPTLRLYMLDFVQTLSLCMDAVAGHGWSMLLYGIATACFSVLIILFLPNTPYSKHFHLTTREKEIVAARIADNKFSSRPTSIQWDQIAESLKDPCFYSLFLLSYLCNLPNGAINVFSSQLIRDLGFSELDSILLNIPRSVYEVMSYILFVICTTKVRWCRNHIAYTSGLLSIISTLSVMLLRVIPVGKAPIVRLFALTIIPTTYSTLGAQVLISTNIAGRTKLIFYTTAITFSSTLGHFTGPLMMAGRESPSYPSALTGYIVADVLTILLFVHVGWSLSRENERRLQQQQNHHQHSEQDQESSLQLQQHTQHGNEDTGDKDDLTDVQQPYFVYRP
ncbi:major facilitator superfamily domain-containing protein [Zychaea mexicana]|uniref:major facilitator superfamily domain-containing protein n=1 Tax=Zychaea mexicana TaxID=64656 RepID=UPI0022FEE564|nr:major facilitator superfamily domain-containing protein [Zychaea mexicana]KAI9477128.1 major facilitator superfamily domain-containing protein [Zychaea mexicana]